MPPAESMLELHMALARVVQARYNASFVAHLEMQVGVHLLIDP